MTTETNPPSPPAELANEPDHLHPDHSCADCLAEENAERWGREPSYRELHPDYVPRATPASRGMTYVYEGGPLDGRRIWITHRPATFRTAEGCPIAWRDHEPERYYRADHAARVFRTMA